MGAPYISLLGNLNLVAQKKMFLGFVAIKRKLTFLGVLFTQIYKIPIVLRMRESQSLMSDVPEIGSA